MFYYNIKLIALLAIMTCCSGEADNGIILGTSICDKDGKEIKKVVQQTGVIYLNSEVKKYVIVVAIPNTYDSQDLGIVCNLPDKFKKDGLK